MTSRWKGWVHFPLHVELFEGMKCILMGNSWPWIFKGFCSGPQASAKGMCLNLSLLSVLSIHSEDTGHWFKVHHGLEAVNRKRSLSTRSFQFNRKGQSSTHNENKGEMHCDRYWAGGRSLTILGRMVVGECSPWLGCRVVPAVHKWDLKETSIPGILSLSKQRGTFLKYNEPTA